MKWLDIPPFRCNMGENSLSPPAVGNGIWEVGNGG